MVSLLHAEQLIIFLCTVTSDSESFLYSSVQQNHNRNALMAITCANKIKIYAVYRSQFLCGFVKNIGYETRRFITLRTEIIKSYFIKKKLKSLNANLVIKYLRLL